MRMEVNRMFGKMMNRYYYGKSGKGDYTPEDLPQTRWQLFWEMLRVRFSALIRLNLMYAVAWLPVIYVIGRGILLWYSGVVNLADAQAQMEAGEMTAEALAQLSLSFSDALKGLALQTLLLLVPALAITGPFTAGVAYITRNWARDEHAFIWSDFWEAVKGNWKQALLTSFITGLMPLVLYVSVAFYGGQAAQNMLFIVPEVICITVVIVWMCSLMYMYPQRVTYRLRYRDLVRNSVIMTIGRLPMTVGLKLMSLLPAAICAAVALFTPYMQYALIALLLYYVVVGFGLSRFVGASYANAMFDRYINPNVEGAQIGRGLYTETDDEDEDEDQPAEPGA